jgi:hypothetical protein
VVHVTWETRAILQRIQYDSQVTHRTSFSLLLLQFYTFFPYFKLFPLFSQTCNLSSLSMRSNPTITFTHTNTTTSGHQHYIIFMCYYENNSYQKQKRGGVAQPVKWEVQDGWPGFNAWQEKLCYCSISMQRMVLCPNMPSFQGNYIASWHYVTHSGWKLYYDLTAYGLKCTYTNICTREECEIRENYTQIIHNQIIIMNCHLTLSVPS